MARKSRTNVEKIKFFFKEYGVTLSGSITLLGAMYAAGIWTANINNSIQKNEMTQRFNEEISTQKMLYNEKLRQLQLENDNLRHQYQLLELNYKRIEHEGNKKSK